MTQDAIIQSIITERNKQDEKWGQQNHADFKWVAILCEEVGEAAQASLHDEVRIRDSKFLRDELIQVAAVAVAWVECIDHRQAKMEGPKQITNAPVVVAAPSDIQTAESVATSPVVAVAPVVEGDRPDDDGAPVAVSPTRDALEVALNDLPHEPGAPDAPFTTVEPEDRDPVDAPDVAAQEEARQAQDVLAVAGDLEVIDDKTKAAQWARKLLADGFVVLDTETTGLNKERNDFPVQLAVIDNDGAVLLDTLLKPGFPIPADATRIHGITNEMVQNAPVFADIQALFVEIIKNKRVVIYNASYDVGILVNAAKQRDLLWTETAGYDCAMTWYAQFYGDWNSYHDSYRWQSLTSACQQQGITVVDEHTALGDCRMTLALIKKMAEYGAEKPAAAAI